MFWLGYLLGRESSNSSKQSSNVVDEHISLVEQYLLGILLPVRGQKEFRVVVRETDLVKFDFDLVPELLRRIGSPVKYVKHYTVGGVDVLEGSTEKPKDYSFYKTIELKQYFLSAFVFIFIIAIALFFFKYLRIYKDFAFSITYWWLSFGAAVVACVLLAITVFPQMDKNIKDFYRIKF